MPRASQQQETPWWLVDESEICEVCGQPHAYGMGHRCAGCDAVICSVCVLETKDATIVCAACRRVPAEGE